MASGDRPLLLLDVEGVLFPSGPSTPEGFEDVESGRFHVRYSRRHSIWLRELTQSFELVWATTWEDWANEVFCPLLRLPPLPVISFGSHPGRSPGGPTEKLPDVDAYVADRAVAWIDDNLYDDAFAWASERPVSTLLIRTDSDIGMTADHVEQLRAFADAE